VRLTHPPSRAADFVEVPSQAAYALLVWRMPNPMSTFHQRGRGRLSLVAIVAFALTTGLVGVSAFALVDPLSAIALTIACVVVLVVVLRTAHRRTAIAGRSVAVLVAALVVLVLLYLHSFPRWIVRDTDMNRWIATELPRGSSTAQVLAFLHRHAAPGETVNSFTDSQGDTIYANIEPNYTDLFCVGDLQLTFYLGHANHLSHHDVVERPVCL